MTNLSRIDRAQLIALAGAAVALAALLLNLGFFFRPGVGEVLGGLAHHAFVLACLLLLTAGSRTVSLSTLGMFWLLGVWGVFGLTYVLQNLIVGVFGADIRGEFVVVWLAPLTEEALKLLPVGIFLMLAARSGYRRPSISDGLLLGFMVGAGVTFQEDAHYGEILGSGDGWGAAMPWTAVFPTLSPLDSLFALNHALWAALGGLSIAAAMMLRHSRRVFWPIALAGPVLALSNHIMANHYSFSEFGVSFLLRRASGGDVPWFYAALRYVTAGGRLAILILIAGAVAAVVGERLILRWAGKRDRTFPSLPIAYVFGQIAKGFSKAGATQLLAAGRYVRLRRSIYFAAWRTIRGGGYPAISFADFAELESLARRLKILAAEASQPFASDSAHTSAAASADAAPVSEGSAGDAPPRR